MAVTTEPPWLNKTSGTAARNGTTSHTISFGFTSTSGSLLVVVMHGAVTHAVSGWTEQAQPVSSGELSLFTKTSAGDTSITATHNGSNYPVNWVAYEFPAGSTLTGIDSTTGSSDTMPGLTGLPGTEQVVIAALGRVTVGSETNGTISPSAPWVEDGDLFAASGATDGTYLAVVHQINVTATSITPTISPTYSGTWGNAAREKISAAFNVAAGSSGFAAVGTARAAAVASGAAVKTVAVTARCAGSVAAVATARKAAPAIARSVAAPTGSVTARHVGVAAGRQAGAPTSAAAAVKRLAAAGASVAAASAVMSGSSRAATGRCAAAVRAGAAVSRSTAITGAASAAPIGRATAVHRTPVAGSSPTAAIARSAALKRLATTGRTAAAATAVGVAGQAGSTRLAAGRCTAAAICRSRTHRRTPRPNSGTTSRPFAGITYRP